MRSKLPAAEAFEECVVGTFQLVIRKNGGYISGEEVVVPGEISEDERFLKAIR
jgi:prophage antirepressor-like protein